MESLLELLFNLDEWLLQIVGELGGVAYLLFFLIVFGENGVIPMIFLPGDGFLFMLGVMAANEVLYLGILWPLLLIAAISGYFFNYYTGSYFGVILLSRKKRKWVREEQLERSRQFFEAKGSYALFLGRFIPLIRTILPFIAGFGKVRFSSFAIQNILGATIWLSFYLLLGYFLGRKEWVQHNFLFIYLGMIGLMSIPAFFRFMLTFRKSSV